MLQRYPPKHVERCLFMGGPMDGTWQNVTSDAIIFEMNLPEPIPDTAGQLPPSSVKIQRVQYVRMRWALTGKPGDALQSRSVFICGITSLQLFDALLECYGSGADAERHRFEQELKDTRAILAATKAVLDQERTMRNAHQGGPFNQIG